MQPVVYYHFNIYYSTMLRSDAKWVSSSNTTKRILCLRNVPWATFFEGVRNWVHWTRTTSNNDVGDLNF